MYIFEANIVFLHVPKFLISAKLFLLYEIIQGSFKHCKYRFLLLGIPSFFFFFKYLLLKIPLSSEMSTSQTSWRGGMLHLRWDDTSGWIFAVKTSPWRLDWRAPIHRSARIYLIWVFQEDNKITNYIFKRKQWNPNTNVSFKKTKK